MLTTKTAPTSLPQHSRAPRAAAFPSSHCVSLWAFNKNCWWYSSSTWPIFLMTLIFYSQQNCWWYSSATYVWPILFRPIDFVFLTKTIDNVHLVHYFNKYFVWWYIHFLFLAMLAIYHRPLASKYIITFITIATTIFTFIIKSKKTFIFILKR